MLQLPDKMIPVLRRTLRTFRDRNGSADPIRTERLMMSLSGEVMNHFAGRRIRREEEDLEECRAVCLTPSRDRIPGSVLYLHGGGYCTGGTEYAAWFGKLIAAVTGARTFCPAYRLAPEHPFPAALEDAMAAFRRLREEYPGEKIVLAGESAGGGLCYALCLRLKEEGLAMPAGIAALSPWTDLTLSGASHEHNREKDPSLTREKLQIFADSYAAGTDPRDPLCSPQFGDLSGLPDSMIFAGGDEILLDDAVSLGRALEAAGCRVRLTVAEDMWHAYLFYNLRRHRTHIREAAEFVREKLT